MTVYFYQGNKIVASLATTVIPDKVQLQSVIGRIETMTGAETSTVYYSNEEALEAYKWHKTTG